MRTRHRLQPNDRTGILIRDLAGDGAVAEALAEGFADRPTLVLIDDPRGDAARALVRAGARGVLPRDATHEDIDAALAAIARGYLVLTSALDDPRPAGTESLTPREGDVLDMLARGLSNKRIGERLALSEHTVKFHVASILAKLGASTRTEAVTIGVRRGLVML
ncbi:MAG: hypothetical protein NVSMB64_28350 [Candidatus Velthaea sp.]